MFPFFILRDQLGTQQKHLLQVQEMRRVDWLICLVCIQDGDSKTTKVRCCSFLLDLLANDEPNKEKQKKGANKAVDP